MDELVRYMMMKLFIIPLFIVFIITIVCIILGVLDE